MSIRIVVAGAILALVTNGATAQSAKTTAPGKPLPLLQILEKPTKAKPHHEVKTTRRTEEKTAKGTSALHHRLAATKKHHPASVQTATQTEPVKIEPAATPASATNVEPATNTSPAAAPAPAGRAPASIWPDPKISAYAGSDTDRTAPANSWPQMNAAPAADTGGVEPNTASAPNDASLSEIVVGGQAVQVASPDKLNAIDLAADRPDTAEDKALQSDFSQAALDAQGTAATPSRNDVGSAFWFAKMLAALGGAIGAGAAAWFLIGSAAQRLYD